MSMQPCPAPECQKPSDNLDPVQAVIVSKQRDIGSLLIRRVLPSADVRSVGPFVFFDHMGPTLYEPGTGLTVRPHPHIGLATLTYLYDGVIRHRDSLGYRQDIKPGAVNWMTAGSGIVHSERSPEEDIDKPQPLMGLQVWVALPKAQEQVAPNFVHLSASSLPEREESGVYIKVIAGECFGMSSKLETVSPLFYVDIRLDAGSQVQIDIDYTERAVYVVKGVITLANKTYSEGQMLVLAPAVDVTVSSEKGAIIVAVGGEPMDGERHLWWNFVASDKALIEQAKQAWSAGKFGHVPGDAEHIPLPHDG
ncbi:pirin family protein [Gilvimarinus sp. SDUM040013]|uniref:Pirin family protein n=1 Tax=Gilvimarinus gilvus TaxID=3058038 RepID=A0ABU4S3E7_9GAMM|nr:pirin family protein [Gilvimarinus sp. SDUM040013]MDO3388097.1 pirin family protein [Gilvimarinus sp. SDUM040013]MDX6850328.1 pirin family protein [Gilvimarinus sp. SDUM040013]